MQLLWESLVPNTLGRLLKRVLHFSLGLSIVSNTFEQNINLGYDLDFVLITDPLCSYYQVEFESRFYVRGEIKLRH